MRLMAYHLGEMLVEGTSHADVQDLHSSANG